MIYIQVPRDPMRTLRSPCRYSRALLNLKPFLHTWSDFKILFNDLVKKVNGRESSFTALTGAHMKMTHEL